MNFEVDLTKLNIEELAKVRNLCEKLIMAGLYGLKGSLGGSLLATEFSEKRSYIVVKNDIPMGRYDLLARPPEHSTLKLDLDVTRRSTKQVRICFTREDWKKITSL